MRQAQQFIGLSILTAFKMTGGSIGDPIYVEFSAANID